MGGLSYFLLPVWIWWLSRYGQRHNNLVALHSEVVGTKVTRKPAQQPASYMELEYCQTVIKHKGFDSKTPLISPILPESVLEGSLADFNLLIGMLISKLLYRLPFIASINK